MPIPLRPIYRTFSRQNSLEACVYISKQNNTLNAIKNNVPLYVIIKLFVCRCIGMLSMLYDLPTIEGIYWVLLVAALFASASSSKEFVVFSLSSGIDPVRSEKATFFFFKEPLPPDPVQL